MTMEKYNDIINLPHHVSTKHQRLSMEQRAAQFAPFAALTGYGDAIKETTITHEKMLETNDEKEINIMYWKFYIIMVSIIIYIIIY